MKKSIIVLCLFGAVSGFATDYFVATNGSDSAVGSFGSPFATIQKAVDWMGAGDTCFIRGGTYHEEVVLDSLSDVSFAAYSNETVVLDGSLPVEELGSNGWTLHSGNVYKTTLTQDISQVFVDGEWMMLARWPNARFDDDTAWDREIHWAQGNEALSSAGLEFDDPKNGNDLAASGLDMTDAMLIINLWGINASKVTNHVAGSDHFQYVETDWNDAHHYYFMDSKLNLLDNETEWYFDPGSSNLYLWVPGGGIPQNVRGKTQERAFTFADCDHILVKGIDFFATSFRIDGGSHITIEDCDFKYPTFSRRTLGDYSKIDEAWIVQSPHFVIRNCEVSHTDGVALRFEKSDYATVENCAFHQIDYTCGHQTGNSSTIWFRNSESSVFRRNSMWKTGAAHGVMLSSDTVIDLNRFSDLAVFQHDAAAVHLMQGHRNVEVKNNWFHDLLRPASRFSDGPKDYLPNPPLMRTGVMHHNVSFNSSPLIAMQFKGDERHCYNNLCQRAIRFSDDSGDPATSGIHSNSVSANNAVGEWISLAGSSYVAPSGTHVQNWEGWLLGSNIVEQVRDWDNLDFRPAAGWVDLGTNIAGITDGFAGAAPDIGAYEAGVSNYWIPGRKLSHTSVPIPPHQAERVKVDADLIWLGAYKAASHKVYFGTHPDALVYQGGFTNNIFDPGTLASNTVYYWRVDAVGAAGVVEGDVWEFDTTIPPPLFSEVVLVADPANSSSSGFGGSLEKSLNDPFAYDPNAPESPLPVQVFNSANGKMGFHGNEAEGVDVVAAYTLADGPLALPTNQMFAIDLYGRDGYSDRDDDIEVQLYNSATLVALSPGNAIGGGYDHVRIEMVAPTPFDRVVIIGHDSGATGNQFTLMEISAAMERSPTPAERYADWASGFAMGAKEGRLYDPDGDRLSNLAEYALGSSPGNGADTAFPTFGNLNYTYRRRTDATERGLTYLLQECTNLVSNDWNTVVDLPSGTAPLEAGYEAVTNQISATETNQFIRLRISLD